MILFRLFKKDFEKKRIVVLIVFLFILISAFLVASGAKLLVDLSGSLDALFSSARVPHFVQMHSGYIDKGEIEAWAAGQPLVEEVQTVEMLSIDGSALTLDEKRGPEENSIMDISFVKQNEGFDFLLDSDNRIIRPAAGSIAVPVYYMQSRDLEIGDKITIRDLPFEMELTVSHSLRDAQMNPSLIHSKRFLLNDSDYAMLREHFHEREHLIEFLLADPERVKDFFEAYLASGLPKQGPSVDHRLFRTLNALTDGIASAVVFLLSLLLMLIALLCLRFTILAGIEEDYREIGVMKAIGMKRKQVKGIYLSKYLLIAAAATLLGYLASHFFSRYFTGDMRLYMGIGPKSIASALLPAAAAAAVFCIVSLSCILILRRVNRISAVEALRMGSGGPDGRGARLLPLKMSGPLNVNIFLGFRDSLQRFRLFGLLCFIFFFSTCIIILPLHLLGTITSPRFISYMGIGRSDIRIDLRQSDSVEKRYESLLEHVAEDEEISRYSPLVSSQFTYLTENGEEESIALESGDFSLFPLDYVEGEVPVQENEIALSYLSAQDMHKEVGDSLILLVKGEEQRMRVSGIYQDVTNGGRTAKAPLPYDPSSVLWYTLCMDVAPQADTAEKRQEYARLFHPARVTDMESYISQTFGNTVKQLKKVTALAGAAGLAVAVLISSLFLTMLIAKDAVRISIMKSIGFSLGQLRMQYLSTMGVLLAIGVLFGTLFSNTIGSRLMGLIWGQMGAPQIRFVIDPLSSYLLLPLLLFAAVALATVLGMGSVKEQTLAQLY
jgi:putative ABC transport system permease protein